MEAVYLKRASALFALVIVAVLAIDLAEAQNLTMSPDRIIFEGRKRKDRVLVNNPGDEPTTYRVQILNKRMLDNGTYEDVEQPREGELFADHILRISPRSFVLPPKSSQTVRVSLRKRKDMPEGEYRSHLRVQALPQADAPTLSSEKKAIDFKIKVNYGITIPVIVRHGELDYKVTVNTIEIVKDPETGQHILNLQLLREGKKSVFGDISVVFKDAQGKEHVLKFQPGTSVYYPNPLRNYSLPLEIPEGLELSNGILTVSYREQEKHGGELMAEKSFQLQ